MFFLEALRRRARAEAECAIDKQTPQGPRLAGIQTTLGPQGVEARILDIDDGAYREGFEDGIMGVTDRYNRLTQEQAA